MSSNTGVVRPDDMLLTFSHTTENYQLGGFNTNWVMRITGEGQIQFNREAYPDMTPNGFAALVVSILEDNFRFKRI